MNKGLEALKILEEHFKNMTKEELADLEKRAVDYLNKIK